VEISKPKGEKSMKPRLVIVALVILALAVPASMLAQQSKAEQEVRAILAQTEQANLKGGAEAAAAFDKLFADEYTRIPPSGAALTKADIVNGFRTGKISYQKFDLSDVKVRIYGNTAVVTGIVKSVAEQAGIKSTSNPARFTRVFVKRDGIWKQVLNQSTRITP
jgi:hypothetical protein